MVKGYVIMGRGKVCVTTGKVLDGDVSLDDQVSVNFAANGVRCHLIIKKVVSDIYS
jgi:hypothetical protein